MIRRLQLTNWRAYENLDLELGPGATFVVASNGVGKTSLIMGAGWGLFGDASGVDAHHEIRGDADQATVTVELRLPSGDDITITRTVNPKGKTTVEAVLGDRTITSQGDLEDLLREEFGADPYVLSQLTTMIHGGAVETFQGEFDLQDHLAEVFGVTPLFQAAAEAKGVADRTASELRKVKKAEREERRDRDELVAELERVLEEMTETNSQRDTAAGELESLTEKIRLGEEWTRYRSLSAQRTQRLDELADEAGALVDREVTGDSLIDVLAEAEEGLQEELSGAVGRAAAARGKAEFISGAIDDIKGADALCPTCLRPLAEHEAERAEEEHRKHIAELEEQIAEAERSAASIVERTDAVRGLLARARELPVPMTPEREISETEAAAARRDVETAQARLQEIDKKLGELGAAGATLQGALAEADEAEEQARLLRTLHRREGIALAAYDSLTATGNAVTERYIEPLAKEVENRWKRMFGSGGLQLSSEGHITRRVGERTLEFGSLSGGEKVWALLLTRLLVASASTRAPFAWLDEPLEHLDPRLRKVVAGTLAKASSGAGLRQVIVTTYEADLARQLMEDVSSASLIYVTSAE